MFVAPLKTNKLQSAISPLFGKAKYFAFVDGDKIEIKENKLKHGNALIEWFLEENIKDIVIKEMGASPYETIKKNGLNLLYAGDGRVTIDNVIKNYQENKLSQLTEKQIDDIISKHESKHTHSHNH